MPNWSEVLPRIDRLALRIVRFCRLILLWPTLYAIAWAAAIWPFAHSDRVPVWSRNEVSLDEIIEQLYYLLGAAGVMATLLVGFLCLGRVRRGQWQLEARALSFNRFFAFSLAAPFLVALTTPAIESLRRLHTLFFITCAAVFVLPTVSLLWELSQPRHARPPTWRGHIRTVGPALLVGGLFVAYGLWFSHLSINNHHALQTRIFDLGIYDNIFYQSSHGNFLGSNFSSSGNHSNGHFDVILVLLSPLYLIYPRAELILVLQAFWLAAGVLPAYLLGRHHVGSAAAGVTLAAVWVLYPAMHGANLYDFHSLTLLATPMMWLLFFLTTGRLRAYFLLLPLMLLIREDVSLLLCFLGLTAILTRDRRLVRTGWITIVVAGIYFLLVKSFIMGSPDPLGGRHGFGWYYEDMIPEGGGLAGLLGTLVVNPTFAVDFALREAKVLFLLQLLLPLAFLPLFGKPWRFAMVFGLFYLLLASRRPVFSIHFQYSVVLFPVLFALAAMGLRRLRDSDLPQRLGVARQQFVAVLLAFMLVASVLTSWKFGGAVPNSSFRGGFVRIPHVLTDAQKDRYANLRKVIDQIPPDASVTAVGRTIPHLSNRAEVWRYRQKKDTDYLIVDTRDLKGSALKQHRAKVAAGEVELLAKEDMFQLFRNVRK